jgi:polysulfide reductase chain C
VTEHHWGWLVAIYLFLGGMGAGAFLVAAVIELTGARYKHEFSPTTLVGAGVSGPLILIGTALLVLDLGAGLREPWRIPLMFLNFRSVMTWGIWILTLFLPIAFLYGLIELMHVYPGILIWARKRLRFLPDTLPYRDIKRVVCSVGCILAVGTALYTGVLLSVVEAVPLWHTPVLPALFLVSAISTGVALSIDLSAALVLPEEPQRYRRLPQVHLLVIGLEVALLALLLYLAQNQGGVAAQSAYQLLQGDYEVIFWVFVVALGLVFPFVVHAYEMLRHRHSYLAGILSGATVVLAGLFVRYLFVAAAIPVTV